MMSNWSKPISAMTREEWLFDMIPIMVAIFSVSLIWRHDPILRELVKYFLVGYGFFWATRFLIVSVRLFWYR